MILQHHKQAPIDAAKLFYHTGPAPGEGMGCGQLENNRPGSRVMSTENGAYIWPLGVS